MRELVTRSQREPGREITQPSLHLLAECCTESPKNVFPRFVNCMHNVPPLCSNTKRKIPFLDHGKSLIEGFCTEMH